MSGIWYECDDVQITTKELDNFCNSSTVYMLFSKRTKIFCQSADQIVLAVLNSQAQK